MLATIVARAKNGVIGKDNQLIWHLPEDLQFFKEKTSGHVIIMGRKTFESLPKLLPNREHWVISNQADYAQMHEGIRVFTSVKEAVMAAKQLEVAYVIGGAQIYKAFMPYVDCMYITEINATIEGDTYFPSFNDEEFKITTSSGEKQCYKYPWTYRFVTYERIKGESL